MPELEGRRESQKTDSERREKVRGRELKDEVSGWRKRMIAERVDRRENHGSIEESMREE